MYLNKALQIYLQICCRHSPIYDMNVRIFWVCVMECTCVQTRPWFILSSEIVILGMESEPLLTPREKSPPSEAQSGDYNPSTDPINCLARHEQTAIFRLRTDTVACERTWSELASWTLHSAIAKKQNRRSTTSSRTVPSGGNRDTSYGRRMSQPPTSCGERRKTCAAPPSSWQHVAWGSKHGWSTAEEEEAQSSTDGMWLPQWLD